MKLAFSTLGCPKWNLDTIIARATEYGFSGVDFRGCAGELDLWKLPEFSTDLDRTARRLRKAGLEVPCVSSSAMLLNADYMHKVRSAENLKQFVHISARLHSGIGSAMVRVFVGRVGDRSLKTALRETADALKEAAIEAERSGVRLVLETHDDWMASKRLAALLELAGQENVGVCWDINHPYMFEGESPAKTWLNLGRWVEYVHVKDGRKTGDREMKPCLNGEGEVPLRDIIAVLRDGRYEGWFTYEWEKLWHPDIEEPEIAFPHYVQYMKSLAG